MKERIETKVKICQMNCGNVISAIYKIITSLHW